MIQQRRVMSIPAILSVQYRAPAAAAPLPWWLAGGAPTPIAVYQPKGAASLAASYVNLANPGTYNAAPGTAPSFDAATGWTFSGAQYLKTGTAAVDTNIAILVRTNPSSVLGVYIGSREGSSTDLNIGTGLVGVARYNLGFGKYYELSHVGNRVLAMAGYSCYFDGAPVGTIPSGGTISTRELYIGNSNFSGGPFFYCSNSIQAVAIWLTITGHATWMPAVSAAVALI